MVKIIIFRSKAIIRLNYLNPRKVSFFLRHQRLRGGCGFLRKSTNIAIGQLNALKSWPYTSKFTYDHLEQIEIIFKSIVGLGKFLEGVESVRSKNPDFVWFQIFWLLVKFPIFIFFLSKSLWKINQKCWRPNFSSKM